MRTTISLDDSLIDGLKKRAAERGTTVSRLIEDSVRLSLAKAKSESAETRFKLVTYGRGGRVTGADLDETSRLLEEDDLEKYGRRGREG